MKRYLPLLALALLWSSPEAAASTDDTTRGTGAVSPTKNPYMQWAQASTLGEGDNAIVFPAITTANTLVTHVSCEFGVLAGGVIANAALSGSPTNARNTVPVVAFAPDPLSSATTYGVNADAYLFYANGQSPRVDVYTSGAALDFLDCTVSGYYQ